MNRPKIKTYILALFISLLLFCEASATELTIRDDRTLFDPNNGIVWQIDATGFIPWIEAVHHCNEMELGDKTNWRMPLKEELTSLNNWLAQQTNNNLPSTLRQRGNFWSLSLNGDAGQASWIVNFHSGKIEKKPLNAGDVKVRCVAEVQEAEYLVLLHRWSNAWAKRDPATYLSYYGKNFVPKNRLSRDEWEKLRTSRLLSPNYIQIELSDIEVIAAKNGKTEVMFAQSYRTNRYHDRVVKVLTFEIEQGAMVITDERVVANFK